MQNHGSNPALSFPALMNVALLAGILLGLSVGASAQNNSACPVSEDKRPIITATVSDLNTTITGLATVPQGCTATMAVWTVDPATDFKQNVDVLGLQPGQADLLVVHAPHTTNFSRRAEHHYSDRLRNDSPACLGSQTSWCRPDMETLGNRSCSADPGIFGLVLLVLKGNFRRVGHTRIRPRRSSESR